MWKYIGHHYLRSGRTDKCIIYFLSTSDKYTLVVSLIRTHYISPLICIECIERHKIALSCIKQQFINLKTISVRTSDTGIVIVRGIKLLRLYCAYGG